MTAKSFRICVSDDVVNDPRTRLARTRFTAPSDAVFWAAGTDPGYLRDLVTYWANGVRPRGRPSGRRTPIRTPSRGCRAVGAFRASMTGTEPAPTVGRVSWRSIASGRPRYTALGPDESASMLSAGVPAASSTADDISCPACSVRCRAGTKPVECWRPTRGVSISGPFNSGYSWARTQSTSLSGT